MAQLLNWDATGEHLFETGVEKGVLYIYDETVDPSTSKPKGYTNGVVWNGLTGVTESPSGAEATALYADDIKYLNLFSAEEFGCTVEAYTYPDEFAVCDGSASIADGVVIGQQARKMFGLCYKTLVGNDIDGNDHGYKLHLVYGCMASPSEKAFATVNDSPEAITFSWTVTTTPVDVTGFKKTACITIDSTKCDSSKLADLEAILYGTAADASSSTPEVPARMPLPDEIKTLMA